MAFVLAASTQGKVDIYSVPGSLPTETKLCQAHTVSLTHLSIQETVMRCSLCAPRGYKDELDLPFTLLASFQSGDTLCCQSNISEGP